jgi:Tfp pilus assembly pilus retraction ATPase PilT
MRHDIKALLKMMVDKKASDIHITAGAPVQLRIDENLIAVDDGILSADDTRELVYSMLSKPQIEKFEEVLELDMAFSIDGLGRFRVNVFKQKGTIASSVRIIPYGLSRSAVSRRM